MFAGAAAVARPNPKWFLCAVAAVGAVYGLAASSSRILGSMGRAETVLGFNANGIGLLAASGLVAVATTLLLVPDWRMRLLTTALGFACVLGLLASSSQGGLLALGTGLAAVAWYRSKVAFVATLTAFAFTALIATLLFTSDVVSTVGGTARTDADLQNSREVRLMIVEQLLPVWLESPITGVGRASTVVFLPTTDPGINLETGLVPVGIVPHNVFLHVLTMAGLIGFCACALVVIAGLGWRGAWQVRRLFVPLLATFAALGFANEWHNFPYGLIPAVAFGAMLSQPRSRREDVEMALGDQPAASREARVQHLTRLPPRVVAQRRQ
jgi:O-antigen ligase